MLSIDYSFEEFHHERKQRNRVEAIEGNRVKWGPFLKMGRKWLVSVLIGMLW